VREEDGHTSVGSIDSLASLQLRWIEANLRTVTSFLISLKYEIDRVLDSRFRCDWRDRTWNRPSIDGKPRHTSPITGDHRRVLFTANSVARTADRSQNSAVERVCAARPAVETWPA